MHRFRPLAAIAVAAIAFTPLAGLAQAWPTKPIIQRLNEDIVKGLKNKDTRDKLANSLGMEVVGSSPEALAALMQVDIPRMADLVRKSGARAD